MVIQFLVLRDKLKRSSRKAIEQVEDFVRDMDQSRLGVIMPPADVAMRIVEIVHQLGCFPIQNIVPHHV